jgi:hypothetical protein
LINSGLAISPWKGLAALVNNAGNTIEERQSRTTSKVGRKIAQIKILFFEDWTSGKCEPLGISFFDFAMEFT